MMLGLWVGLLVAGSLAVAYFVTIYNGLISVDRQSGQAWSNIDVLLKQRHDELPKLVSAVEGYMAHERETLERVVQARNAVAQARGVGATAQANAELEQALQRLFAVAESYPQLKADTSFLHLQERISELEEQIADRREFYNYAVNRFNVRIAELPDVFVARMLGLHGREYFQVAESDRQDVKIEFSNVRQG